MTVSTTTSRNDYVASTAQTIFPYTFKILYDSDLEVYIDGVLKMLSTHYTVTGAGGSGGNVTFLTPMVGGEDVAIIRNIPLTQDTDYVENDPFPAETHEAALDKLTMLIQQVDNRSLRSIRIPEIDSTGTLTELPVNTARASKFLAFDTDGDVTVTGVAPTGTAIITPAWETVLDDTTLPESIETIRNALTDEPSVAPNDEVLFRDTSSTTGKRGTVENVLKAINLLTEDESPDDTADFVLTYDTSASGLKKAKPGNLVRHESVRQTAITGSVDSNGQANFLSAGTGLAVSLAATTTPVIITGAAGENEYGPINYRSKFAADQANYWSALPASNLSFLMLDRDISTGAVSAYSTLVPPQYDPAFNKTRQALLHFEGADASTTITDDYGNVWTVAGGAQIDTAQFKFGSSSLLLDGTGDYVYSNDFTSVGNESWTLEGFVRFNALPASTAAMDLVDAVNSAHVGVRLQVYNNAGTYQLRWVLSSDATTGDIASLTAGTITVATGTQYHWAVCYDEVAGKYFAYWDGVKVLEVTSAAKICAITRIWLGAHTNGVTQPLNGWLDEFRMSSCCRYPNGTTFTPAVAAFTPDAEWFDLSEFKWKYGAPSAWTEKQRVCVGEATTGAATVSSVTTYALRGRAVRTTRLAAVNTSYSVSHNIGTRCRIQSSMLCIDNDGGVKVGRSYEASDLTDGSSGSVAVLFGVQHEQDGRNGSNVRTCATGIGIIRSGGGMVSLTAGKWDAVTTFDRGW